VISKNPKLPRGKKAVHDIAKEEKTSGHTSRKKGKKIGATVRGAISNVRRTVPMSNQIERVP